MQNTLKPFNYERAMAGDPVVTKKGDKIMNLTDMGLNIPEGLVLPYRLAGVDSGNGRIMNWTKHGSWDIGLDSDNDLCMAPVEKKGWIKIFPYEIGSIMGHASCVFDTEEEANDATFSGINNGIVIPISWHE